MVLMRFQELFWWGWFSAFKSNASVSNLCRLPFPHLYNTDIYNMCPTGLLQGRHETKNVKC